MKLFDGHGEGFEQVQSILNSSITPLASGATYTGTFEKNNHSDVGVSCQTDNGGTLYFDFSPDSSNVNTFPTNGFTVASGIHEFHIARKLGRYFRVRLVNNTGAQSYLRLYTYYGTFGQPSLPLNQSISSDNDASIVRSVIVGQIEGTESYDNVLITSDYELLTNTLAGNRRSRACYVASSVSADVFAVMVDLSDTVNYPHNQTNGINIDHFTASINFTSGTAQARIRLGVITRIDGTSADISYLIADVVGVQTANDSFIYSHNYQPSSVKFKVSGGALVGGVSNNVESAVSAVNTGITLPSSRGVSITPAVGDVILKLVYVADSYDANISILYHSD